MDLEGKLMQIQLDLATPQFVSFNTPKDNIVIEFTDPSKFESKRGLLYNATKPLAYKMEK